MALFEFDRGRLIPAQFGRVSAQGLTPEMTEAVCAQVLEIVSRPLFPITWRNMSAASTEDQTPRLTALDAAGQVVSVEVLDHLDSTVLITSLSRLAGTASLSWNDLAHEYPGGVGAFKAGWIRFRESMPPSPGAGPRLVMVVGSIDPHVRPALDVLAASGVEVHEMSVRHMSNGRAFLDVQAVGPRMYAHAPRVVTGRSEYVSEIPSASGGEAQLAISPIPAASLAPAPETPSSAAAADSSDSFAAASQNVPSAMSAPVGDSASAVSAVPAPSPARVSSASSEESTARVPARIPEAARLTHRADVREESDGIVRARMRGVPVMKRDLEGFRVLAQVVGEEVPLIAHTPTGAVSARVNAEGVLSFRDLSWEDPQRALHDLGYGEWDAWTTWRLGDAEGPTLAEALNEVNLEIVREYERAEERRSRRL